MKRGQKTRQDNLLRLLDQSGMSKKDFAHDVLDCTPSYFSQLISSTKPKPINDEYASRAEAHFGKPQGWLDWPADYKPNSVNEPDMPEYVRRRYARLPKEQQEQALRTIDDVLSLAEGAVHRPPPEKGPLPGQLPTAPAGRKKRRA